MKTNISICTLLLFFISCNHPDKKTADSGKISTIVSPSTFTRFIQPPLKGVDVPFKHYTINAAKGDTVFYRSSIIIFPSNAFVDKNGNVITGNVHVRYREFSKPIDTYLAGITMNYDSAGNKYHFESLGMCEMNAFKDGEPVFVNPSAKPEVNMMAQNTGACNLYFLDTVKRNWVPQGTNTVTVLNHTKTKSGHIVNVHVDNTELIEPVKPGKADSKAPVIQLIIDPASFKELMAYNNLKFELDVNEKTFNPNDTAEEWNNVELLKTDTKGLYTVRFSNAKRTISYKAHPVLEGKDYDKALAVFDQKNEEYKRKLNERLAQQEADKRQYSKDSLANVKQQEANEHILQMNKLIDARNKAIEKENVEIAKQNKITERENKLIEELKKKLEKLRKEQVRIDSIAVEEAKVKARIDSINNAKYMAEQIIQDSIDKEAYKQSSLALRSFEISGFGVWNCDRIYSSGCHSIYADFRDSGGNKLLLANPTVVWTPINSMFQFPSGAVEVALNTDNMIFGIYQDRFAYITPADFKKLNITQTTTQAIVPMTIVSPEQNTYSYIISLVK